PEKRVGYIGNCRADGQDPIRYVYEYFSMQDNCSKRYRHYADTLDAVIKRAGARIQVLLAGHDHCLQLLFDPTRGCDNCPKVMVISGAGSKRARVKSPAPPSVYTHPLNDNVNQGESPPGFVVGKFHDGRLKLEFVDGRTGAKLDMGGRTTFDVDESGSLVDAR
ncbi:MAG: hypothetical protein H7X80_08645, partial [bacterium]|nr:hypothetical protein [Candidatus Kapabacteria bacterium]